MNSIRALQQWAVRRSFSCSSSLCCEQNIKFYKFRGSFVARQSNPNLSPIMNVAYILTVIVIWGGTCARADLFLSVHQLIQLFEDERDIVSTVREFVSDSELILNDFRRYLKEYEGVQEEINNIEHKAAEPNKVDLGRRLAGNPLHGYQLIKRLSLISSYFDPFNVFESMASIFQRSDLQSLFTNKTLQGAAEGLIRLQNVYKMNASSLVDGNIMGLSTLTKLSIADCLFIGETAYNIADYTKAIEWLNEVYTRAEGHEQQRFYQQTALNYLIAIGQELEKQRQPKLTYVIDENNEYFQSLHNYKALCRGEQLLSDSYLATLKCYYEDRNLPHLKIMPFKAEQHHHEIPVIVFHDVIYESEIRVLKELVSNQLIRSLVVSKNGVGGEVARFRISKQQWISVQDEDERLPNIHRRIALATGLNSNAKDNSSELLQVANYGIGGHYEPHHDYLWKDMVQLPQSLSDWDKVSGDRMATFMFYLDDVERGGATAFPNLGISIFPRKGSAVFWYNSKKSGKSHRSSLHGGCPVLYGSKWVTIRWIRENVNFLNRPCSLSPYD